MAVLWGEQIRFGGRPLCSLNQRRSTNLGLAPASASTERTVANKYICLHVMAICYLTTHPEPAHGAGGKGRTMFAQAARCLCRTLAKATCPSCLLECWSTCQTVNRWHREDKLLLKDCVLFKSSEFLLDKQSADVLCFWK